MEKLQARIQKLVDQYGADKLYWDYDIVEEENEYRIIFMGDTMPLRADLVKEIENCLKEFEQDTKKITTKRSESKMEKYNYKEVMKNDVLAAVKECMAWEKVSVEDLDIDNLKYDLWTDDSVTGNGSGSYTMNSALAKEYVLDNEDLHVEVITEFGLDSEDIAKHLYDYEYWDVSIRCYLLDEVLQEVLEELQA